MTAKKALDTVRFVYDTLDNPEEVIAREDMGDIHDALRPALTTWMNECDGPRKILMTAAVGSVNYNLLNDASDLDLKAIYMPNLSDFYHNQFPQFNFVTDAFDCQLSPAHKYIEYVLKGSLNHFEPLVSDACLVRPDFAYIIKVYLEPMTAMNVINMVKAAWFMGLKANNDAVRGVWKPKKAANALRILTFLITYLDEGRFEFVPTGSIRDAIMRLKDGVMAELEYSNLYTEMYDVAKMMAFTSYQHEPRKYELSKQVLGMDETDTPKWTEMRAALYEDMMALIEH